MRQKELPLLLCENSNHLTEGGISLSKTRIAYIKFNTMPSTIQTSWIGGHPFCQGFPQDFIVVLLPKKRDTYKTSEL